MAFTVLAETGNIPTFREEEEVHVQLVQITSSNGVQPLRVESRIHVDNPRTGYNGPTKVAIVMTEPEDVLAFIDALQAAHDELVARLSAPKTTTVQKARVSKAAAAKKAKSYKEVVEKTDKILARKPTPRKAAPRKRASR